MNILTITTEFITGCVIGGVFYWIGRGSGIREASEYYNRRLESLHKDYTELEQRIDKYIKDRKHD